MKVTRSQLQKFIATKLNAELPESFSGMKCEAGQISGGEIFVGNNYEDICQAFKRGATAAITEIEGEFAEYSSLVIRVEDLNSFVLDLVSELLKEIDLKVIFAVVKDRELLPAELLAHLLVAKSRGWFRSDDDLNLLSQLTGLTNINSEHSWALLMLDENSFRFCYSKFTVAACLFAENLGSGLSSLLAEDVLSSMDFDCFRSSIKIISQGIAPLEFEAKLESNEFSFKTNLIGGYLASQVLLACVMAYKIDSQISVQDLPALVKRFVPLFSRPKLLKLGDGRQVLDFGACGSEDSLQKVIGVFREESERDPKQVLLVVNVDLPDKSSERFANLIAELEVLCLVGAGDSGKFLKVAQDRGKTVFTCKSPESAAHTIGKIEFSTVYIIGASQADTTRVIDQLIFSFGESFTVPVGSFENFTSEDDN